ncbi:MAG: Asp-tRNA(Asn)/Glu-tRNA(Gln) amidotransferase subunit GatA, partial [Chloroflexi bacterium]|nr:Asp-tRNA(Asn)/Glu-tRNA(Gln) amidotransferase subunit GatA [Chloroflexota bacterium]
AAAVAAGECAGALGSDTGGSIRQPAGLCGVVGMKPTYGRVSRYGLVAFASSLDQIGPLARNVEDAAILLEVIAGHDPQDSTSVDEPVPPYRTLLQTQGNDLSGLRIGKPEEYFVGGMEPAVEQAVLAALDRLQELGAQIVPVNMPHTQFALPVYYLIATAEASANLARYDGVRFGLSLRKEGGDIWDMFRDSRGKGFGAEVKRRIMLGTYALSTGYYDAYYLQALKARTLIRQDFDRALEQCDLLAVPTTPAVAFPIGKHVDDPLQMYLTDIFTISLNLAGLPGISVPCGFAGGLPVGLQFQGRAFDEATILRAAHAYEQTTGWHTRRPAIEHGANPQ